MLSKPVVFVDIETNGGSVGNGKIIEIAAIRYEAGEIVETFESFINPGTEIPFWITNLTGITNNDVAQAPKFQDIAAQLKSIFGGAIFAAARNRAYADAKAILDYAKIAHREKGSEAFEAAKYSSSKADQCHLIWMKST